MTLLARVERAGIRLEITPTGKLVADGDLTDEQVEFLRAHKAELLAELTRHDNGVRGDGRPVSWDGFLLDDDGLVIIHDPCDGDGCGACEQTGLVLADGMT